MQNPGAKEKKVRVFELAKELNVASKDLIAHAQDLGFAGLKNQLNTLEPEQVDALKDRVKKGVRPGAGAAPAAPTAPPKSVIPTVAPARVQTLPKPPAKPAAKPSGSVAAPAPAPVPVPTAPVAPVASVPAPEPVAVEPVAVEPAPAPAPEPAPIEPTPAPVAAEAPPEPTPEVVPAPVAVVPQPPPAPPQNVIPNIAGSGMRHLTGVRNLNAGRPGATAARPPVPAGPSAPSVPPAPAASTPTPPVASPPAPPRPTAPSSPAAPVAPAAGPGPRHTAPTGPGGPPPTAGGTIPPRAPTTSGGVIPPAGPPGQRPSFLNRAPQVPPSRLAPPAGGSGVAPRPGPSGSGGPASGPPRPGGPGVGPRPGGPGAPPGPPRPGAPGRPAPPGKAGVPMKLTPEMIERLRTASARGQKLSIDQIAKGPPTPAQPSDRPGGPPRPPGPGGPPRPGGRDAGPGGGSGGGSGGDDDDDKKKGQGGVIGRDARHKGRQSPGRGRGPSSGQPAIVVGPHGQVDIIEQQWGSRRGPRAALLRKHMRGKQAPIVKEGRIEIAPPINVRSLSEAIGMKSGELGKRLLKETGQLYGNNSTVEFEVAALIAAEKNIELVLKKQETAEDKLLAEYEKLITDVDEAKLQPRPPIVTIMGHVDHGKTSLLDKIRQEYGIESDVVSTEAGGITQVIRAWSVKRKVDIEKEDGTTSHEERYITFLDTPGHEAFTKMRARGANVTDIVVIVVAATDGVMPQTEEAISHAKAADVKIIVAINKVDMPNANIARTRQQLYGQGLIPDDMGGEVQFVETSAVTGQGITELLDTLVLVAEVEELKADPDRPAAGTCLEAYMSADEGVMATVLIQQGTLKRGDIVLCGSAFGRVRAMYNDVGKAIRQAGPSTPVRITGLDHVPNADDPFYVVDELTKAKEIAEARLEKEREEARIKFSAPKDLDSLSAAKSKAKITELKVILKAEARGSVEAIRKELEKLVHEEVRTRVLLAGIGAITESDVILALTSPDDTLVIGFNVTADDAALRLAEARGVSLREYQIIYNLVDDVKAALEGRLKPIEEVVHLGRAVIRDTFKISKVGTIAGCYVTSGTIERSARVRIIREGVVVYPAGDKVVGLDSLKRFKDDVRDVREGFECGMKIVGFDDVKVGDVIEAFKIEIKHRTL